MSVRAVLGRDTTTHATAEVLIVVPAFAWVSISAIHKAADHQAADLDRIAGTVEVTVTAPTLACHDLVGLQLQVTGPAGDTLLPRIHFDPPTTTHATAVFVWEAPATVNGESFPRVTISYERSATSCPSSGSFPRRFRSA